MIPYNLKFKFNDQEFSALVAESSSSPYVVSFKVFDQRLPPIFNGQFNVNYTPEGNYSYHFDDTDVKHFVDAMTHAHQVDMNEPATNSTLKPVRVRITKN